ncbi:unnamed protein product (macronuclear) [Paramecium tetraurelia]|uniref:MIR domain protein n=1 Tax=Paramecium tetraurelia TaxID=5888 RepID=A0D4X7_PARTE|nr:uncharacterized protein GSPATT00013541001 [Paramecium tetraurelia]CAK78094.1 unnamed protein product [Paramecium tetraurelia]|eukprot:XP_001445491.1 hypothetical protein (macronuclear) [Paramecium tetraurelia strain d4-2]
MVRQSESTQIVKMKMAQSQLKGIYALILYRFLDPNAYYMQIDDLRKANNFRDSLFTILPRGTFELHDEYLKEKKNQTVDALKSRVSTEASQYYTIIQSRMHEEILLGAEVVFKHVDSQRYLFGSYDCSEVAMDAFKLKLSPQLSSHTIFKLAPYQTYQKEGQIIQIDEPLIIVHEKTQCKLDYEKCRMFLDLQMSNGLNYKASQTESFNKTFKQPINTRDEAVVSLNSDRQWKFQLHEQNGKIIPNDLCFFIFSQDGSYLTSDGRRLLLQEYKDNEYIPLDCVWELQLYENKYVIRSQISGFVINSNSQLSQYEMLDDQHLQIEPAKLGTNEVSFNMFVKIKFDNKELQKSNVQRCKTKKLTITQLEIEKYQKLLGQEDLDYVQYNVQFLPTNSVHGFQIKRLNEDLKKDLLLITSSHEILKQFINSLQLEDKLQIESIINEKILTQVLKVIQKLIAYLLNCEYMNIDKCENLPIHSRQLFMKDLRMVEIIIQIIFYFWEKHKTMSLFLHKNYEKDKLRQICIYSYVLIEKMARNNSSVKLYISQWLEFFLKQAIDIDDEQIQISLAELLNDNYYSINKFVQEATFQNLVKNISEKKNVHEKHLRIFSSIIICDGKPIIKNQIELLNKFFKPQSSDQNFYIFKFLFKEEDQKIKVQHLNKQWFTLKEFHDYSQMQDDLQTWNYFLAYINLLSDICQNRNKQGTNYVHQFYELSVLSTILQDPETEQINAIDPFLKLIHSAFIDSSLFAPIRRIARVREWAKIKDKTDIIKTKTKVNKDQKRVLEFIQDYITKKFNQNGKEKQYFKTLYTVLYVLKTTIRLGYWEKIDDLKNLLEPLFNIITFKQNQSEQIDQSQNSNHQNQISKIIKSQNNFQSQKKRFIEINTENMIMLKCKQISCEILDIIVDMETNVRVSISTINLKDFFEKEDNKKNESKRQLNEVENEVQMKNSIRRLSVQESQEKVVEEWKGKFSKLIKERDLFGKFSKDIISKFAELSKYDNEILQTYSIKLLKRIYGYRKELIENFDKTIIVNAGFTHKLSEDSRKTRTKLLSFNDFNILNLNLKNQSEYNIYLWVDKKDTKERGTGVIQDLCWLIECLKSGDQVLQENVKVNYDDFYAENRLQQVYTEKEQNFKLHQSLIKCQDLHENILVFINIATKMINEVQEVSDKQENESNKLIQKDQQNTSDDKLIMKTLYVCFQFLTMLLWNHHENKQDSDFIKIIPNLFQYIKYNLFCIQFLRELFQNNKSLLFNESKISQIINEVVKQCNALNFDQYYKAQLIDFLRILTIYNNKSIKINQNLIMAALQNRNFQRIMILFDNKDSIFDEIEKLIADYQIQYFKVLKNSNNKDDNKFININPKLTYLFNYFQLLVLLISNKNEINLGKCKQMHSHLKLIRLYQRTGQCWPLKRYLRAYINRLYYEHNKDFIGICQNLIEIDLENILNDLKDILELRESGCDYQKIKLSNPTRFSYLCSYFYMTLEENLVSLNFIFDQLSFFDELEDTLKLNQKKSEPQLKQHSVLLEFGNILLKIEQLWSESELITNLVKVLMVVFCNIYKTFDLHTLILRDVLSNPKPFHNAIIETTCIHKKYINGKEQFVQQELRKQTPHINQSTMLSQKYQELQQKWFELYGNRLEPNNAEYNDQLKDILLNEVYDFANIDNQIRVLKQKNQWEVEKKKKKIRRVYEKETKINMDLNKRYRNLMELFLTDKTINVYLEEEFNSFCTDLDQIKYSDKLALQPPITLKEFIQNIIHLNLNHYDTLSQDIQIFFLKALEKIIRKSENESNPELQNKMVKQQQNFLLECGAAELICKFLRIPNLELRQGLTNSLISFGNAFLERGNRKCQNEIYQKLLSDSKNKILINYRQLIRRVSRAVYNNFKFRKNKPHSSFPNIELCDNFDFYDELTQTTSRLNHMEKDDAREEYIKEEFINLLNRSFRFLQLLCENNNVQMKNFIRQQIDPDLNPKIGSINFIELATSQLRVFCKAFNSKISEVPIYILDFILEVVQVPCLENQITLCKTTFFEDVCYLVQQLSIRQNQEQRGLLSKPEGMQALFNIYNKIIIIIMSVLEGNDDRIQEDLQKKIDPKFLIEIVRQYLQNHNPKIQSKEDMEKALEEQSLQKYDIKLDKNNEQDQQIQKKNDNIEKILNVLIIKEKIKFQNFQLDESSNYIKEIMKFLETKILRIEIIYENKPQTILYPSRPLFTFLSDETRDIIMYNVNRETQRDKINGLLEYRNQIYRELQYNYELSKREFLPITSQYIQVLRHLSAFFSISVNILMILFYNMEIYNFQVLLKAEFYEQLIINVLSFCQLFTTLVYYICYLNYRIPICIDKYRPIGQDVSSDDSDSELNQEESDVTDNEQSGGLNEIKEQIKQSEQNQKKNESKIQLLSHILSYILDSAKKISQQNEDFIQITFYLVFSILGTFYKSYFFSLHLFDLFSRLTLLNNVFQAISHNAKQLIVVSLLGVLFIYVFSFTSFDQYADDIYTEKQPEEHCETLISCMITLVTSGVIGTSMSKWDFVKFCYDTLYFVFFALLFTNIVSGIMIDTFAELRDQRQKIDDDKKNCCFICGVKRAHLEKNLEQFEQHVKDKHFLWNYIYYIYCLKLKETTDYTGLEYAISEMIRRDNISWQIYFFDSRFPIQFEQEANQDKEIDVRIAQLEGEMREKNDRIAQLELEVKNKLKKDIPSKLENLNQLIMQMQSSKKSN